MRQNKDIFLFDLGEFGTQAFTQSGRRRVVIDDGVVFVNADVILADGTKMVAVLEIDEMSSGEHCGTYFLISATDAPHVVPQSDICNFLSKSKTEVFPYKYKLRAKLCCEDIHVNANGWSR